jgi:hypothetical protein
VGWIIFILVHIFVTALVIYLIFRNLFLKDSLKTAIEFNEKAEILNNMIKGKKEFTEVEEYLIALREEKRNG